MFFTSIETENDFNKCIKLSEGIEREFLYDCGSTTETPTHYLSNEFKKHLNIQEVPNRISKCVGVHTVAPIEQSNDLFVIPDCSLDTPFEQSGYYRWLAENKGLAANGHVLDDKRNYLSSLGFVKGQDNVCADQLKALRLVHSFFWESQCQAESDDLGYLTELSLLIPKGESLSLPSKKLKEYTRIKRILIKAGGVYRKNCFVFKGKDAAGIQEKLLGGDEINDKKKFQFFETPAELVEKAMNKLALKPEEHWLEPSAGKGALANAAKQISDNGTVVEIMQENADYLKEQGYDPIISDFTKLAENELGRFDKILSNPPFSKNQDCTHIMKMYKQHLKDGGRMVSFASQSWLTGQTKQMIEFRSWLESVGAVVEEIEAGAFKLSGTSVKTTLITIDKLVNQRSIAA